MASKEDYQEEVKRLRKAMKDASYWFAYSNERKALGILQEALLPKSQRDALIAERQSKESHEPTK